MGLDQIGITLSGVIAIWLTQDKRETWRRWACTFGMLAQPFWFYAAWKAEQWGIFAMCTLYSYAWPEAYGQTGSARALRPRSAAEFHRKGTDSGRSHGSVECQVRTYRSDFKMDRARRRFPDLPD